MSKRPPRPSGTGPRPEGPGWRHLAVLAFLALLVLGCVWLAGTLRHEAQREDCLATGRRDCDRLFGGGMR